MRAFVVTPTIGQTQVPGQFRSLARVKLTIDPVNAVTQSLGGPDGVVRIEPDAGYVSWLYEFQGVSRYGRRIPIEFSEQFIETDIAGLDTESLLVVLRFGVTATVSIRRYRL